MYNVIYFRCIFCFFMKILKSFDTKIDAEELLEATEKYGE
jgi:hypothetical protein